MRPLSLAILAGLFLSVGHTLAGPSLSARIDTLLETRWKADGISPSASADDATFLRRVWLDLAGQTPPPLKAREFLADARPDKRARLVDELLASPEFAEHWGRVWTELLTERRPYQQDVYDGSTLSRWLAEQFAAGRSYREIAGELVNAQGPADSNGAVTFLLRYNGVPIEMAGGVGKQLLGTTIHCAQCHDHPLAHWKKEQFWSLAAVFARARRFTGDDGTLALFDARTGEVFPDDPEATTAGAGAGRPVKAIVARVPELDAPPLKSDRRKALAAWITADINPYLSRQAVSQVWGQLFGRRLAQSFDHLEAVGRSPDGPLLELLAVGFKEVNHDLKGLLRAIVLTRIYGLSATPATDPVAAANQERHFARFPTRALSLDQLYHSIGQATGHRPEEPAPGTAPDPAEGEEELPDNIDHALEQLGDNPAGVQRALMLLTGEYVNQAVSVGVKQSVTLYGKKFGSSHVEWLYLSTLSRKPDAEELAAALEMIRADKKNRGAEDFLWAMLNSVEFTTNH